MFDARLEGTCRVLYCLDVARAIDLRQAEERLASAERLTFRHKSRAPSGSVQAPALRVRWIVEPMRIAERSSTTEVVVAIYDFGALCVTWTLPFEGQLEQLVALSGELYGHTAIQVRSRALADEVVAALGSAVDQPRVVPLPFAEDYFVFQTPSVEGGPSRLLTEARDDLARVLRAEPGRLSAQEVDDALSNPVSYRADELCLTDWLGAFLVGSETEDEHMVLELATVELLELRVLDSQLDGEIEEAYDLLARRRPSLALWNGIRHGRRDLERIGRMQADDAVLLEGVDNALKLLGDDYLARLYRTAAARFHFTEWDTAIERKLGVLRSVHGSLADQAAHRRSEALEWIIILLIAFEIVLSFAP